MEEWHKYGERSKGAGKVQRWTKPDIEAESDKRVVFVNCNLVRLKMYFNYSSTYKYGEDLFAGIFRRFFQPSSELAKYLSRVKLPSEPGMYGMAQMRAKYPKPFPTNVGNGKPKYIDTKWFGIDKVSDALLDMQDNTTFAIISYFADHAVECVVRMMPTIEYVYVASDQQQIIHYLKHSSPFWADNATDSLHRSWKGLDENLNSNSTKDIAKLDPTVHGWGVPSWEIPTTAKIVARDNYDSETIHFDSKRFRRPHPALYPTFVDLWIMAHAGYHSFGLGGFGRFASILAGNDPTKISKHRDDDFYSPSCATLQERQAWMDKTNSTYPTDLKSEFETNETKTARQ